MPSSFQGLLSCIQDPSLINNNHLQYVVDNEHSLVFAEEGFRKHFLRYGWDCWLTQKRWAQQYNKAFHIFCCG